MEHAEYAVGIIPVYRKEDTFLFCLVQHEDGHWGFPKGHKEGEEGDEETARRELREETGIDQIKLVPDITFVEHYSFERDGRRLDKEVTYFLGIVSGMKSEIDVSFTDEIIGVRWLPHEEAKQAITFDESRKLLDEVWGYLEKHLE